MEYKTFSKNDIEIKPFLTGQFSNTKIAIPVRSVQGHFSDQLTFQILSYKNIDRPNWVKVFATLFRLELLGLVALPFFIALLMIQPTATIYSPIYIGLAFSSVIFLFISVFTFNDYYDHIKGGDSYNTNMGSQVIQQGWVKAITVLRLSLLMFITSVFLMVPVLMSYGVQFIYLGLFVSLAVFGFSIKGKGFKNRGMGDLFIFICFGPLIFYGMSLLLGTQLTQVEFLMSCLLGWLSVFYQQTKNLKNIYIDEQYAVGTLISRLGFDISRRLLLLQCLSITIFTSIFISLEYKYGVLLGVVTVLLLVVPTMKTLIQVDSPMSGKLQKLSQLSLLMHYAISASYIISIILDRISL